MLHRSHRLIVQIRRMEILLAIVVILLYNSSMRARNLKYLIARVSFWLVWQRINNIARAENVLKMKNSKRFLRKVFTSSSQTSLKDQYFHFKYKYVAISIMFLRAIEEHRRMVTNLHSSNLDYKSVCRCDFWLFFKKIIHNSKSIGPFDLILILLGALAHFSQERLFYNSVGSPLLVLVVCAFVSTALHCGHSKKSELKFSGEEF